MRQEETEINIEAPPEAVWKVMTDFDSLSDWNPMNTGASGRAIEGTILDVQLALPNGEPRTFRPRLIAAEPNKELRWLGKFLHSVLFSGEHYSVFEPTEEGGTRFLHGEKFSGLLMPLLSRVIGKSVQGFELMNLARKERVEGPHA